MGEVPSQSVGSGWRYLRILPVCHTQSVEGGGIPRCEARLFCPAEISLHSVKGGKSSESYPGEKMRDPGEVRPLEGEEPVTLGTACSKSLWQKVFMLHAATARLPNVKPNQHDSSRWRARLGSPAQGKVWHHSVCFISLHVMLAQD